MTMNCPLLLQLSCSLPSTIMTILLILLPCCIKKNTLMRLCDRILCKLACARARLHENQFRPLMASCLSSRIRGSPVATRRHANSGRRARLSDCCVMCCSCNRSRWRRPIKTQQSTSGAKGMPSFLLSVFLFLLLHPDFSCYCSFCLD